MAAPTPASGLWPAARKRAQTVPPIGLCGVATIAGTARAVRRAARPPFARRVRCRTALPAATGRGGRPAGAATARAFAQAGMAPRAARKRAALRCPLPVRRRSRSRCRCTSGWRAGGIDLLAQRGKLRVPHGQLVVERLRHPLGGCRPGADWPRLAASLADRPAAARGHAGRGLRAWGGQARGASCRQKRPISWASTASVVWVQTSSARSHARGRSYRPAVHSGAARGGIIYQTGSRPAGGTDSPRAAPPVRVRRQVIS